MRITFICAIMVLAALFSRPAWGADWSIDIVPDNSSGKNWIAIEQPFYVVLTNKNSRSINIWNTSCSLGYGTLNFLFKDKDGKLILVTPGASSWGTDIPDVYSVGSGKHFVIAATFKNEFRTWNNIDKLKGRMTVVAIYKNTTKSVPESKLTAWVGEVASTPICVDVIGQ